MDTLREAASAACRDYLVSHVLAVEIGASRTARMLAPSVVDKPNPWDGGCRTLWSFLRPSGAKWQRSQDSRPPCRVCPCSILHLWRASRASRLDRLVQGAFVSEGTPVCIISYSLI
jgi:hypothetical protein